jgi:hypothetical protein
LLDLARDYQKILRPQTFFFLIETIGITNSGRIPRIMKI